MESIGHNMNRVSRASAWMSGAVGMFFIVGLLFVAPALAGFEQVGTFGNVLVEAHIEEKVLVEEHLDEQLLGVTGIAVNVSGAGGVPAATVYAGSFSYTADGKPRGQWVSLRGGALAIDQVTGEIYSLTNRSFPGEHDITLRSADGSQLIDSFGEVGAVGETFDEGPEKIHSIKPGGIAVNGAGVVYVADNKNPTSGSPGFESRVMAFRPETPSDHEHYVYAGRADDIVAPQGGISMVAVDDAGDIYTAGGERIYEFVPGEPATVVCEYQESAGGIRAMTVNPTNGEVFYYSEKNKQIHQLSTCNQQGEFEETAAITVTPKPTTATAIEGLAFNPALAYEASRPPGILYAVDQSPSDQGANGGGRIFAPAEVHLPAVASESVASVTSSGAVLGAQIDPKGSQTHYVFQYIAGAAYEENEPANRFAGAGEAPFGGGVLGSGQQLLSASVALTGLSQETEYHYRVIATNANGSTPGLDQTFTTFPAMAPGLPDGRAYELVSPAQKNGGEVFPAFPESASCAECKPGEGLLSFPMQSSPDGEAVVYEGSPFSSTGGAVISNEYLSKRTASGWQTTNLTPALMGGGLDGYRGFNAELTRGVLFQEAPSLTPDAPSEYGNLYTQSAATPSTLTPLVGISTTEPSRWRGQCGPQARLRRRLG